MVISPSQKIINDASESSGLCGGATPDVIYHYTSLAAARSILCDATHHNITLNFTHFQHLNDETEVVYGLSAINAVANKLMEEYSKNDCPALKEIAVIDLLDKLLNHLFVRFTDETTAKDFLEPDRKIS